MLKAADVGKTVMRPRPPWYRRVKMPKHHRAHSSGRVYEHIIVAEEKLGRPLGLGETVHHLNGDRIDNRPENIVVYSSGGEHLSLNHARKVSPQLAAEIRQRYAATDCTLTELGAVYGLHNSQVCRIVNGTTHRWAPGPISRKNASRGARRPRHWLRGEEKPNTKLSTAAVVDIRRRYAAGEPGRSLARLYGIGASTVFHIIRRETWAHLD